MTQHQPSVHDSNLNQTQAIFRLRDMFKPSLDLWIFSWLLGLIFAISLIALLMISGWFITGTAIAGMLAVGSHSFNYMLPAGIIRMLAISRTASRYGELMIGHHAVFNLLKTLRLRFFTNLAQLPLSQQRRSLHASQAMHRLVSDIDSLDEFILRVVSPWLIGSITLGLLAVFIGVVLPITLILKIAIFICLVLALLLPFTASYLGIKQAKQLAHISETRRQQLLAPLSIITQLVLWQQWFTQTKHYANTDKQLLKLEWQNQKKQSLIILGIQWLFYASILLVLVGIIILGNELSIQSMHDIISIPLILAVVLGLLGIQEIIIPLGQHYLSFGNSVSAKNRLNDLLSTRQQNQSTPVPTDKIKVANFNTLLPLPTDNLTLKLDNVSAKIPEALVGAKNVSTTVTAGTPLIIKGASGCGKSTLLQALAGELAIATGKITLNGKPWQDYDWQDQVGYLGQQLDIFDQTLASNLRLGKQNATDSELIDVLKKVGLDTWLEAQPQGLATPLGEYGIGISGGQARRIALARLLLKPRAFLLLDEPFAGLDDQTRQRLWQTLRSHQQNSLLIIVSHQKWDMQDVETLTLKGQVF